MRFSPEAWRFGGELMDESAADMYDKAFPIISAEPLPDYGPSPVDVAISAGDKLCNYPWYAIIAGANEMMTALGTRMFVTGANYADVEAVNTEAASRYWMW